METISRLGVKTMTNTFSLNYEIIAKLFENSVCLTYNPLEPRSAWQYAKELQQNFEKEHNLKYSRVCSQTAKMWQSRYNPKFHYFSDGTLIHNFEPWQRDVEKLERILTLLKIRGWPVKKIYAPNEPGDIFRYSEFLRYISEQAFIKYSYTEDLYVESLPEKEDFVKQCFANGNILLTASKNETLPSQYRDFVAFFCRRKLLYHKRLQESLRHQKLQYAAPFQARLFAELLLCR